MDREICHNTIVPFPSHLLECVQKIVFVFFLFVDRHENDVLLYNTVKCMHIKE